MGTAYSRWQSKQEEFSVKKYTVLVNNEKYPDIYEKLEEEKKGEGISRYVRELVKQDIMRTREEQPKQKSLSPLKRTHGIEY